MTYPVIKVEIAFADGPYYFNAPFTDVTTYVRNVSTRRGRNNEWDNFESGTAVVVLDNRDRRFDPYHTTGPYYGNLLPRRQIKITATVPGDATTYDVFRGFVDGWPVEITDAGYDSTVTLQCYDALGLLATEELPDDLAANYIASLSPLHFWPLDDPVDPTNLANVSFKDKGSAPTYLYPATDSRVGNLDGLAPGLPNTCLTAPQSAFITGTTTRAATGTKTIVGWWKPDPNMTTAFANITVGGTFFGIGYDVGGATFFTQITVSASSGRFWNSPGLYLDTNVPHHFAIVFDSSPTVSPIVYIDGILLAMTNVTTAYGTPNVVDTFSIGGGQFQQFAIFAAALTATQMKTIYSISLSQVLESTNDRFVRLTQYTPYSAISAPSPAYTGTVLDITPGGPPVVAELQLLADSEGGNLYVSKAGVLTFTSRYAIWETTSITSQATFGGAGISIAPEIAYQVNSDTMRNTLAVSYSGEGSTESSDAGSVSTYGTVAGSINTQLSTVDQAQALADVFVGFSKDPTITVEAFEVNVAAVAGNWSTVLGLELLQRITLDIVPRTGSTISTQQIVQAIEHTITPGQWSTTLNGSVRFTNVFIIGSSLIGGADLIG